jgi:hypothetical protein
MMGLFEGMFRSNIFTFNPAEVIHFETYHIKTTVPTHTDSGPADCVLHDPDGNPILFNQF